MGYLASWSIIYSRQTLSMKIVQSYLLYAKEVWHSISQDVTERMVAMQKRVNTIINNRKRTNVQNSYNAIEALNAIKAYSAIRKPKMPF